MNSQEIIRSRANYHFSHASNWSREDREEFQVETDEILGSESKPARKVSMAQINNHLAYLRSL